MNRLTPAVFAAGMVQDLARVADRLRTIATYQIKIDTGLSRLGIDWEQADDVLKVCSNEVSVRCDGIYTHLSSSDQVESASNAQVEHFQSVLNILGAII